MLKQRVGIPPVSDVRYMYSANVNKPDGVKYTTRIVSNVLRSLDHVTHVTNGLIIDQEEHTIVNMKGYETSRSTSSHDGRTDIRSLFEEYYNTDSVRSLVVYVDNFEHESRDNMDSTMSNISRDYGIPVLAITAVK